MVAGIWKKEFEDRRDKLNKEKEYEGRPNKGRVFALKTKRMLDPRAGFPKAPFFLCRWVAATSPLRNPTPKELC
jgi:hypothetical protein